MSAFPSGYTKAIAVFSSRESVAQLRRTIASCVGAVHDDPALIDVLINGNSKLAHDLCSSLQNGMNADLDTQAEIRVWHIDVPDKAHTWNVYLHQIWPNATHTLFVDGYCEINSDAFKALSDALLTNLSASVSTGLATVGMSAKRQNQFQASICGINGNLYCLTKEAMLGLRQARFRLPLGIYRTDPTLESILKFSLNPAKNQFEDHKVVVEPSATYWRKTLSPWSFRDLSTHFRRMLRQAQGDFEQQAVRQAFAFDKKQPDGLPDTARELVLEWIERFPHRYRSMVLRNPLRWFAIRRLRVPLQLKGIADAPALLATFKGTKPL